MTIKKDKLSPVIFLGVISSNRGSSNSIRNAQVISRLERENRKVILVDFGIVFNVKLKLVKLVFLSMLVIKSFGIIALYRKGDLIISTNPKWLLLIPFIAKKKFTLYLGDPFYGDVSKEDSFLYSFLWHRSQRLIKMLNVFSPFLHKKFKKEMGDDRVRFLRREPIIDLPKMMGEGVLYLGDFHLIDRNFEPIIAVLNELNIKFDMYGDGEKELIPKDAKNITIFERKPLNEILEIIPKYKIMVIILNKSGFQVPGKIYDFVEAPFRVLILYEDYLDIKLLPQPVNYYYCKNVEPEIRTAVNELL